MRSLRASGLAPGLAVLLAPLVGASCVPAEPGTSIEQSEVLGGTDVPPGKWTDAVAIRAGDQQFCTGTLIAPTVVLTAGHCNDGSLDNVLIGTSSLARANEGETITVIEKVEHPDALQSADLTVLVLAKPSRFAPRAIATGWAKHDIVNGAQVQIVGFGATDPNGQQYVAELQEATTTITDADCTTSAGCNASVQPAGELGAGGMGIDSCFGDSGGPLYLLTPYGEFLAGATSRGYEDSQTSCSEGGIYVRPDKFIDWIERSAGRPVTRGPEPSAELISAVRGHGGETTIVPNDPKTEAHTFTLKTPPQYGTAKVREDGRVRVCTNPEVQGGDRLVVTVADAADPTRALDVEVNILIEAGDPGDDCDVDDFRDGDDDGGGCCDSGRSPAGALPLAIGVLAVLVARPRRRRR